MSQAALSLDHVVRGGPPWRLFRQLRRNLCLHDRIREERSSTPTVMVVNVEEHSFAPPHVEDFTTNLNRFCCVAGGDAE